MDRVEDAWYHVFQKDHVGFVNFPDETPKYKDNWIFLFDWAEYDNEYPIYMKAKEGIATIQFYSMEDIS